MIRKAMNFTSPALRVLLGSHHSPTSDHPMRFLSRPLHVPLWLLLVAVAPAMADSRAKAEAPPLAAIGWLGHGKAPDAGTANCSGVLIAPDIVITADHCLTDGKTGQAVDPAGLTFAAGLGGAKPAARRHGKAIWLPPKDPLTPTGSILGYALGLLQLDRPLSADEAPPMPMARTAPLAGTRVVMVGYPRTAPDRPALQDDCRITLHDLPVIAMNCDAVSGFSGGAVLAQEGNRWVLTAVLVAQATNAANYGAIALIPPPDVAQALEP